MLQVFFKNIFWSPLNPLKHGGGVGAAVFYPLLKNLQATYTFLTFPNFLFSDHMRQFHKGTL